MQTIIISDFDGTITSDDIAGKILENSGETEFTKSLITLVDNGDITVVDYLKFICCIINNYDCDYVGLLDTIIKKYNIKIDVHVYNLKALCDGKNIQFRILSGGFKKAITYLLRINKEIVISHDFEIVNNKVIFACNDEILPKGKYVRVHFPKDKFFVVFIGDGISDFSVVEYCSIVFAKKKSVLESKCIRDNIDYFPFNNFNDVIEKLSELKIL
jgi:2-hydroxy-3-keto-5-methylthiopentenyl-1-phosphate phosphatase